MRNEQHNKQSLLRLHLRQYKAAFIGVLIFSGVANLLMLTPAFYMLNIYDKAVGAGSVDTLVVLSIITAVMFGGLALMEIFRSKVLLAVSGQIDVAIGTGAFDRMYDLAASSGGGRVSAQPLKDVLTLRQFISGSAIVAIFDAPWLPIYLGVLFLFHPLLGWLGCLAVTVLTALAVINSERTAEAFSAASQKSRETSDFVQRSLRTSEVVATMGMLDAIRSLWRSSQDDQLNQSLATSESAATYNSIVKVLRMAIQSGAIGAGAYLAIDQQISAGMIIAGSIVMGRALQPLETVVSNWRTYVEVRDSARRLEKLFDDVELPSPKMPLPPIEGVISAKTAFIAPPGSSEPTLSDVNLHIGSGETVLIVGPSGAGKSTLIKAVLGLWRPLAGKITLDGAEIKAYDRTALGPQIGYLPQSIELLEGSVAENISRFGPMDPSKVVAAAQVAGTHEFIMTLPNGYDTELGPRAIQLSPGQRQRIGLARALYDMPKFVVLDEPNSNLDQVGDQALAEAISTLKKHGSTIIVVTHRQGLLQLADMVLKVENGSVTEYRPEQPKEQSTADKTQKQPSAASLTVHPANSLPKASEDEDAQMLQSKSDDTSR